MVVDVVTKSIIAHFRAHTSPLAVVAFDPSGTLLVTASVCGHSLNVFHLLPSPTPARSGCKVQHAYSYNQRRLMQHRLASQREPSM